MYSEIIFDLETKKLFEEIDTQDPGDLGVSVVSLYLRRLDANFSEIEGQLLSFWEADFPKMFSLFSNIDRIIGFNSLKFDVPALKPYSPYNFAKLSHFDIMDSVKNGLGFRLSLSNLANSTLGRGKTDVGTNAVVYWNESTPESLKKLQQYCEADVLVTRDIYDYGLKHQHLKYIDKWNTPRQFTVDFSRHQSTETASQFGLF